MEKLGLRDLKEGNVLRIEFGNGKEYKGLYAGTEQYTGYTHDIESVRLEKGHFLLIYNMGKQEAQVISLKKTIEKSRTTIKGIYRTRLPKALGDYCRAYLAYYTKQQEHYKQIYDLSQKGKVLEGKYTELKKKGKGLKLPDELATGPELFDQHITNYYFDIRSTPKNAQLSIFQHMLEINLYRYPISAESVGMRHYFEYDGANSYHGDATFSAELVKELTRVYKGATVSNIRKHIELLNKIDGLTATIPKDVYTANMGDYNGDGNISIDIQFKVGDKFKDYKRVKEILGSLERSIG